MRGTPEVDVYRTCTCQGLRIASRLAGRIYDNHLAPAGLTQVQFSILIALSLIGPKPLGELAASLHTDRTAMNRNVGPLVDRGLIAEMSGSDRRQRLLALSKKGRQSLDDALPLWKEAQAEVSSLLGGQDRQDAFTEHVASFSSALSGGK